MNSCNVAFNERAIEYCGSLAPFVISGLKLQSCKNAALKNALDFYDNFHIKNAIQHIASFVNKKYKFILIDVKHHLLEKGEIPCIPGWHVDGGPSVESEYVLCTTGSSLTEFYTDPLALSFDGNTRNLCNKLDQHIGDNPTMKMSDWQIFRYNNMVPHRGAIAHIAGPRLLIRAMGSDKIPPQTIGSWQPTQYRKQDEV